MLSTNSRDRIKTIGIIAGAVLGSWLLTIPVGAQVGVGCECVSDPPVEAATAIIAASVTTSGGAGLFQGQAQFLDAMMQTLASGIPDATIYFGLYVTFRWAGKHDSQWAVVYPVALRNRTIFLAGADPSKPDPKPPRRVIFKFPKFNA